MVVQCNRQERRCRQVLIRRAVSKMALPWSQSLPLGKSSFNHFGEFVKNVDVYMVATRNPFFYLHVFLRKFI